MLAPACTGHRRGWPRRVPARTGTIARRPFRPGGTDRAFHAWRHHWEVRIVMTYDTQGRAVRDPDAPVNINERGPGTPGYVAPAYVTPAPTPVTIARRVVDTLFGILE